MHYIQAKSILSPRNGMNLYRGCQHGCIYCDSRSRCYHMDHRFEDIAVKENAIELLTLALKRKRQPCMIGTGAMTDALPIWLFIEPNPAFYPKTGGELCKPRKNFFNRAPCK